ncbi:hypothetical protein HMPREF1033_03169, partial [Tannerella sp. 6_1_58FAA_CT1]
DVIRQAWPSVLGKERERHHPQRAGEGEGNEDGRLVRNAEGTLWPETHQGKDEVDRNPVHLLWHPQGECSTARPAGSQRNCSGCLMFEVSEKRPFHWSIGSSWVQK